MGIRVTKPDEDGWIKGMVYGDPGVGKTVFLGSCSVVDDMSNLLFVNLEGGVTPLRDHYPNVDVVSPSSVDEFNELYDFLATHVKLREQYERNPKDNNIKKKLLKLEERIKDKNQISDEPVLYRSVAIDSLTEIQKLIMANIMGRNPGRLVFDPDLDLPRIKEWGQNSETVRLLVRTFRNLPIHVWFSAHKQRNQDDKTGEIEILPSLPGKLPDQISGMLKVVGYMYTADDNSEIDEFKNVLLLKNSGKYKAKSRYNSVDSHIIQPTMQKLYDQINFNNPKEANK